MIIIPKIKQANKSWPERVLNGDEKETIIASWGDENNYWYFQEIDREKNTTQWQAYIDHTTNNSDDFFEDLEAKGNRLAAELQETINQLKSL